MQIQIDQEPITLLPTDEDFAALAHSLVKVCADRGRVVVELQIDGQVVDLEDQEKLRSFKVGAVQTVIVRSESIENSARQILLSLAESIPRLIEEFANVNEDLQSRDTRGAFERVSRVGGYWIEIVQGSLHTIHALGVDLSTVEVPTPGAGAGAMTSGLEVLTRINDLLSETQNAFENEDNLEIGDIFEYDLPPLLRAFQQILLKLAQPEV